MHDIGQSLAAIRQKGEAVMRKIAMVTGAAGGMGRAICAQLLADGFHVIGADINWGNDKMDPHPDNCAYFTPALLNLNKTEFERDTDATQFDKLDI